MLSGCYRRQDLFVHKVIPENTEKWKSNAVNVKLLVKIFFPHVEKYLKDNKHNSLHLAEKYPCLFVCKQYLFLESHSFPQTLLSEDNYPCIFWNQKKAIVYISETYRYIYMCVYFNIHKENTLHLNIYKLLNNFNVEIQLS